MYQLQILFFAGTASEEEGGGNQAGKDYAAPIDDDTLYDVYNHVPDDVYAYDSRMHTAHDMG